MTIATYPAPAQSTPGAQLGYAEVTATQTGVTTEVDLVGLAVTVYIPAGRRIRVTAKTLTTRTVADGTTQVYIKEGTTTLQTISAQPNVSGDNVATDGTVVLSPTPGIHTYKLALVRATGTGTVGLSAGAVAPAFILVEDITGGTGGPGPIQLAYAALTTDQTGISAGMTPITNLSTTVAIPANRRIKLTFHAEIAYSDATTAFFFEAFQNGVDAARFAMTPRLASGDYLIVEGSVILSPAAAGTYTFDVRAQRYVGAGTLAVFGTVIPGAFLSVEDITGTPSPAGIMPTSQTLAYVEKTATQAYTVANTVITGLSATVTVAAGRRIKVRAYSHMQHSVANGGAGLRILEDGVSKNEYWAYGPVAGSGFNVDVEAILSPSAGTHTYTVQGGIVGGGTVTQYAAVGIPAYLIVEDITGGAPAVPPVNVPVGVLAQAQSTTSPAAITTATQLLSVNVVVPAGRTLKVTAGANLSIGTAGGRALGAINMDGTDVGRWCDRTVEQVGRYSSASDCVLLSPSAGSHTISMWMTGIGGTSVNIEAATTEPIHLIVEDVTPTPAPANTAPSSTLAYAEQPSSLTGLTTALTDITGLSVTVTVPADRRLRISGHVIAIQGTAVENKVAVYVMEGATKLGFAEQALNPTVGTSSTADPQCVVTPSAGTHTYKLAGQFTAGTSNQFYRDPTNGQVCFILVEDITAAGVIVPTNTITDFFFNTTISNGSATTLTDFLTQNNVGSLPYAYTMVVTAYVNSGFQGALNFLSLQVRDEAGGNINYKTTVLGTDWVVRQEPVTNARALSTILGKKDYAAGATCGFRLAYKVDTSNTWADVSVHVRLVPR